MADLDYRVFSLNLLLEMFRAGHRHYTVQSNGAIPNDAVLDHVSIDEPRTITVWFKTTDEAIGPEQVVATSYSCPDDAPCGGSKALG